MAEKSSLIRHPSTYRPYPTPTEEEVYQLFDELKYIFEQYQKEVPKKRRPWPESIRTRVLTLWSLGVTSHQISEECQMPAQTLYSWRQRMKKQKNDPGFSQVPITRGKRRSNFQIQQDENRHSFNHQLSQLESRTTTPASSVIVITFPNGMKIEGLCYEQAQEIIRGLV